jgi:hypothetical protein
MDDREFWLTIRRALLLVLDALERKLGIAPRTAELRCRAKLTGPLSSYADGDIMSVVQDR